MWLPLKSEMTSCFTSSAMMGTVSDLVQVVSESRKICLQENSYAFQKPTQVGFQSIRSTYGCFFFAHIKPYPSVDSCPCRPGLQYFCTKLWTVCFCSFLNRTLTFAIGLVALGRTFGCVMAAASLNSSSICKEIVFLSSHSIFFNQHAIIFCYPFSNQRHSPVRPWRVLLR